ncbi:hypothetical protein [Arthrobacter cheniae]|nr:hypothetical protein [Arthrobacter cheniae]
MSTQEMTTTRPKNFTQDPDNPNLWWGPGTETEFASVKLVWTGAEGLTIAVDCASDITPVQLAQFTQMLLGASEHIAWITATGMTRETPEVTC